MSQSEQVNTKSIVELTQIGAALSGDFEEVLLHDPTSTFYKEHLALRVNEILNEIDLEHLAQVLQKEALLLEKYEEHELAEKRAHEAEKQKKRDQEARDGSEKVEHQLTPAKIIYPEVNLLKLLAEFSHLSLQITQTQQTLRQTQALQQLIQNQWQAQQQQQANQFIQAVNGTPVLLPNGNAMPTGLTLNFDPKSREALELKRRLEAAPMIHDLLNTLEKTDMRDIYDKQVALQQHKLRASQPGFANDDEALELAARQQAVFDLNLDLRQLQNKFVLGIAAIHSYMKRQSGQLLNNLVEQYNQVLGVDVNAAPHKKVGIYKILERTIAPYLAPKLTMENRNKRNALNLDHDDLQVQAMKTALQRHRLEQQNLARLGTMRALVASLRHVAAENPEFGFLHAICDRVGFKPEVSVRNKIRPVPKGYLIK